MSYNSKYKGEEVEAKLEKVTELNVAARDLGVEVEDVVFEYVTEDELNEAVKDKVEAEVVVSTEPTAEFPVVKTTAQTLTEAQKTQARDNLGMKDYINALIDDAIGDAINGGY
jgi:DNA recombination-dependent growth factor C